MGHLSECLRLLRVVNDKNQKDFSVELGISAPYLSEIETGKKKPSFEVLNKYSEVLNIPVSSILFFSESGKVGPVKESIKKVILNFMAKAEK